jgi:imidazolonepropionase-like amidohydrolase
MTIRPKANASSTSDDEDEDADSATKKKFYTVIKTRLLIPGDGDPLEDAALVIENKLIAWVGAQSDLPKKFTDGEHRSFEMPYLMPGLWEVHSHFGGDGEDEQGGKLGCCF